jgi:hypothetical protein
MQQTEFNNQIKILLDEYRSLNRQLDTAPDRNAVMQQMQDCVRRQNALREQFKKGESNE